MIATLIAVAHAATTVTAAPTPDAGAPPLSPAVVIARYEAALRSLKEPRVITFDYTLEQTGPRTLSQTHRVYRSGDDERDETLTVDGKRLAPPKVRIFRGRRNRYTVAVLAPRPNAYRFAFAEALKDGHHVDYVFHLTSHATLPFTVTDVTIDGVRFLPLSITFATSLAEGQGSIDFGSNARWWVPCTASARATVGDDPATEKLTFYTYRFPPTLPSSTFTQNHRLPPIEPTTGQTLPAPVTTAGTSTTPRTLAPARPRFATASTPVPAIPRKPRERPPPPSASTPDDDALPPAPWRTTPLPISEPTTDATPPIR